GCVPDGAVDDAVPFLERAQWRRPAGATAVQRVASKNHERVAEQLAPVLRRMLPEIRDFEIAALMRVFEVRLEGARQPSPVGIPFWREIVPAQEPRRPDRHGPALPRKPQEPILGNGGSQSGVQRASAVGTTFPEIVEVNGPEPRQGDAE